MKKPIAIKQGNPSFGELGSPGNFRFSGHQTFPLRIAWIPKASIEISKGKDPLTKIDEGIVSLGLGKNMIESLRCWIQAFQIVERREKNWKFTQVGERIFSQSGGLDPYLEDHSTSLLLHWLICTNTEAPFFAWECLFNRWSFPEFSETPVIEVFRREREKTRKPTSNVTLLQHWQVFLHSYRPPRGRKAEDHLDSALSVLGLIHKVGERRNLSGKVEPIYSFNYSAAASIPQQLFTFFLHDWWNNFSPHEKTVSIGEIVAGAYSPGRILKMQESEILERVEELAFNHREMFQITESKNSRQLRRLRKSDGFDDLNYAYKSPRLI